MMKPIGNVNEALEDEAIGVIGAAIDAMEQVAQVASRLSNLVTVAQRNPLEAVSLAEPLAASIVAVADALPVKAMADIKEIRISNAAGALSIAKGDLESAAAWLVRPETGTILAHAGYALEHTRDALEVLDSVRYVFTQMDYQPETELGKKTARAAPDVCRERWSASVR